MPAPRYTGGQLTDISSGGATIKYWYDNLGNQDCVTASAGSQADCNSSGSPSANLVADYTVDYLSRITSIQQYSAGTRTDLTTYTYDAMDRTVTEVEDHTGTAKDRTTNFTYQGLTNLLTEEKQSGGDNPKTKSYSYDAFGHRLGMVDQNNGTGAVDTYSYGTDAHGSISQLIDDAGYVKASYGYSAYGGTDAPSSDREALTTGDTDAQAPLNPMRYAARRADSGSVASATAQPQYDMGTRRFGPDIGRFLQQDAFAGALGDLGLSLDPLTQNRYALAGGNPISYVEIDGHMLTADGGGGGSVTASPPPPNPAPSDKDSQGGIEGLKRFGSAFLGDLKKTGEGALHLYDTLDRCGSENDKSACDQLHQQFATKQGWTNTWNALKEPFVNDCKPSANRAPECAAHVASAAAEIFIGGKGAGRAASTAGKAETTAATSGAKAEAAAAAKPSTAFDIVQGAGTTTRKINFRPSNVDPKWGLTAQHLNKHLFGSGNKSLKTIDPGGNASVWTGYLQDLASRPVTSTTSNGMQDIIGTFPKANGSGTFQFGIRLSPRPDGTFDLVTLLTKQ
jgi:RHS repeat-associated protein